MPDTMTETPPVQAQTAAPSAPGQMTPGPTAPATVAPQSMGNRALAMINANIGLNMLEQAATQFGGSRTEEGRDLLQAIVKLRKRFGSVSGDLSRAQVKMLGERANPIQPMGPQQGQAWQQAIKQRQGAMGMQAPPGAAPTGG